MPLTWTKSRPDSRARSTNQSPAAAADGPAAVPCPAPGPAPREHADAIASAATANRIDLTGLWRRPWPRRLPRHRAGRGAIGRPRAAENVAHGVVALVARVLVEAVGVVALQRKRHRPRSGPRPRIVHGRAVLDGVGPGR